MAKANKIVLGKRPETFPKEVTFPMLDGSIGCIKVDFQYRTRKEHAVFVDEIQGAIEMKAKAEADRYKKLAEAGEDAPQLKQSDLVEYQMTANVDTIMGSVKGWNLDVSFDRKAVEQLVDELPAAVAAIVSAYREAIVEGRLGN